MGRPIKIIDWTAFDKLCGIQCTLEEIASFFEVSEDTIERAVRREKKMSFADYFHQKRADGRISLRRVQYQKALGGNITMLIWLGKQYLNQSEKVDQKINQEDTQVFKLQWADELEDSPIASSNASTKKNF